MARGGTGRRALQVVLLVGGLFVLGLLCGEQARAADGVTTASKPAEFVRSVTSSAEWMAAGAEWEWTGERSPDSNSRSVAALSSSATSPSATSPAATTSPSSASGSVSAPASEQPGLSQAITPVTDGVRRVVGPVTEQVVRPVTGLIVPPGAEHVVQPIGDLVDQITDGLTDGLIGGIAEQPAPPQWWPSLPQQPTPPGDPTVPGVPELPESPELPELPLPAVPGQTLPAGTAVPQQPGGATDKQQPAGKQPRDESAAVYGPRVAGDLAAAGDDVRHHAYTQVDQEAQVTGAVQAPVHQVPDGGDGDPTGALGRCSAVDNGSPRHGDAQAAVTLNERARPMLVPGPAAEVTAAGTRDRHRDIPAFPG